MGLATPGKMMQIITWFHVIANACTRAK